MFGTLGGPELFLILVVALIVFGPRKLPEIGKSLGKMMAEFRKASTEFRRTIEEEVETEKIRDAARLEPPPDWHQATTPAATPPAGTEAKAAPAEGSEGAAGTGGPAGLPGDHAPGSTISRDDAPVEPK